MIITTVSAALLKLWVWCVSTTGLPFRLYALRRLSEHRRIHDIEVYVVRKNRDTEAILSLVGEAIDLIKNTAPQVWLTRVSSTVEGVLAIDTISLAEYFLADRCLCCNPWQCYGDLRNEELAKDILAGGLVWGLAAGYLIRGGKGPIGVLHRRSLSLATAIRFLERLQRGSPSIARENAINVLRTLRY